ncbi:MAG TPA: hypothetical protein PKY13_05160 [Microthrixaceae bacterium]|jgi:hypothetical protein|nr:hypothetical protein [Microthrixaceae bacterium]HQF94525.1 hypothetical protein [Microthrixaceae bacterium]
MLIWFAAGSVAIVWVIFRSPAVDYRVVALGSVLALVEVPIGVGPFQTLMLSVVALALTMGLTVGQRLRRRRWLGIPIGMFLHLVLDASWSDQSVFWWPFGGWTFPDVSAPVIQRGIWSLLLELVGCMVALWLWGEFGLDDPERRRRLWRTGQLDRSLMRRRGVPEDDE